MQGQGPQLPPTRKAAIHIHSGGRGKYITLGGVGGPAKPGSYGIPFDAVQKAYDRKYDDH